MGEKERLKKKFDDMNEYAQKRSIWINRIPVKTKEEFLKLADDEFESDWGMTLKWLVDFRKGLLDSPNKILDEKIDILADEFANLKKRLDSYEAKKDEKVLTTASGRKIKTRTGDKQ